MENAENPTITFSGGSYTFFTTDGTEVDTCKIVDGYLNCTVSTDSTTGNGGLQLNTVYNIEETSTLNGYQYMSVVQLQFNTGGTTTVWNNQNGGTGSGENVDYAVIKRHPVRKLTIEFLNADETVLTGATYEIHSGSPNGDFVGSFSTGTYTIPVNLTTATSEYRDGITGNTYLQSGTTYCITETDSPSNGGSYGSNPLPFSFSASGWNIDMYITNNSSTYRTEFDSETNTLYVKENRISVTINKVDRYGNTLSPATFTLYKLKDGGNKYIANDYTEEVGSYTSNMSLTMGNYKLVETDAPSGYKEAENPIWIYVGYWNNQVDFQYNMSGSPNWGSTDNTGSLSDTFKLSVENTAEVTTGEDGNKTSAIGSLVLTGITTWQHQTTTADHSGTIKFSSGDLYMYESADGTVSYYAMISKMNDDKNGKTVYDKYKGWTLPNQRVPAPDDTSFVLYNVFNKPSKIYVKLSGRVYTSNNTDAVLSYGDVYIDRRSTDGKYKNPSYNSKTDDEDNKYISKLSKVFVYYGSADKAIREITAKVSDGGSFKSIGSSFISGTSVPAPYSDAS